MRFSKKKKLYIHKIIFFLLGNQVKLELKQFNVKITVKVKILNQITKIRNFIFSPIPNIGHLLYLIPQLPIVQILKCI